MNHINKSIFPLGEKNDAYAKYFVGQSYLKMLSTEQIIIANVTFEAGCRNNWHIHEAREGGGQILIAISGRGYYQEEGKAAQELHSGDVINIKPGIKHWHGAAKDSAFSHLAIEVPGIDNKTIWLNKVNDDEYFKLK